MFSLTLHRNSVDKDKKKKSGAIFDFPFFKRSIPSDDLMNDLDTQMI